MAIVLTTLGIIPKDIRVVSGVLPAGLSLQVVSKVVEGTDQVGEVLLVGTPTEWRLEPYEVGAEVEATNGRKKPLALKITSWPPAMTVEPNPAYTTYKVSEGLDTQEVFAVFGNDPTAVTSDIDGLELVVVDQDGPDGQVAVVVASASTIPPGVHEGTVTLVDGVGRILEVPLTVTVVDNSKIILSPDSGSFDFVQGTESSYNAGSVVAEFT